MNDQQCTSLSIARDQIIFARSYTQSILETVPHDQWFSWPNGSISHIAWQVGHLAMAQYRLAMQRVRGTHPNDSNLVTEEFLQLFGRGSTADTVTEAALTAKQLHKVFHRVHCRVVEELRSDEILKLDLNAPVELPHRFAKTKFDALMWCGQHEMLHAGQIGLLRRQLGYPTLW